MSDQADPLGDGDDSSIIRALRQQNQELAAAVKTLQGDVARMSRSSVFDEAGIPKGGPAAFFREKYDGELTREAVETAARQFGILAEQPPATPPEEQGSIDRMFEPSATPPKADASVPQQLLEQMMQAGDNDAIEALLEGHNLLIHE